NLPSTPSVCKASCATNPTQYCVPNIYLRTPVSNTVKSESGESSDSHQKPFNSFRHFRKPLHEHAHAPGPSVLALHRGCRVCFRSWQELLPPHPKTLRQLRHLAGSGFL